MIMIALIEEIERRLKHQPESGLLSYFFCEMAVE